MAYRRDYSWEQKQTNFFRRQVDPDTEDFPVKR